MCSQKFLCLFHKIWDIIYKITPGLGHFQSKPRKVINNFIINEEISTLRTMGINHPRRVSGSPFAYDCESHGGYG